MDLLPLAEAAELVREIVGAERADAEPEAVSDIVRLCARLPLALRIVAHRAHGPLAELVEELAEEQLDTLSTGTDERSAVRAVFSWSYRALPTDQAAMFDLLGVVPGPDVSVHAAAACAGITIPQARRTLRALADAHLVNEIDRDRFGCHDLLRSYARDLAARQDQTEPLRRLVGFYLHTAAAADQLLFPVDNAWHPDGAPAPAYPLVLNGHRAALAWFEEERANLIAAVRVSSDKVAWQLAAAMWSFFKRQANTSSIWVEVYELGLAATIRLGDKAGESQMHNCLSDAYRAAQRSDDAVQQAEHALRLCRELRDRHGEAAALNNLGDVHRRLGNLDQAIQHYQRAVRLREAIGDRHGLGITLNSLAAVYKIQNRFPEAILLLTRAIRLRREVGDLWGEAITLNGLGWAHHELGHIPEAQTYWLQAQRLFTSPPSRGACHEGGK